jgi:hypothetical protein
MLKPERMSPVVTNGAWQISVSDDDGVATYAVHDWVQWPETGPISIPASGTSAVRAVVEVRKRGGGVRPRAAVGGELRSSDGARVFRVGQSVAMTLGSAKTYPSKLSGTMVPGLPPEFAQAALGGLVRGRAQWSSGGLLVVDRGAYDEVDSSPVAFGLAAGMLLLALVARLDGTDLDVCAVDLPV